ncbi:MAG TPA: thiamine pyrophosphate-dependent enzyme [Bacteroidia bacterium]|nr:transketolase [Bacteroidia bacterium]MBX3106885.1 transketolase [Bacteroidota bacterium]OQB62235.1 MAG: 2-oxoisovalerate dehydrogenase subunit beta [Bacteroidetes bacterium ADurb.Bin141]MBV6454790.1 1-deoxy-D-xylulose-5-phosphate synthase [Bacteroidia bacterium]HNR49033.1 thiamine pyrophosphate-dependent enzyme [Bacteroidia bacterium]
MSEQKAISENKNLSFEDFKNSVKNDYRIGRISRETSLLGRKEVLTGKAKFGIFGDGKEVAQIAMAKYFRKGDYRSGYYRDQTFMFASELLTVQEFFAQLYAHPSVEAEPATAGRAMNGHYATRMLNDDGSWKNLTQQKNSSADISPTAGQMPRLLGLALASKFYRNNPELKDARFAGFSDNGNEVAFGTIGDASTSEGIFFETINAAGVLQVPMVMSVWDDGYGISVPNKFQTTKQSISEVLQGFGRTADKAGYVILKAKGWDYPGLCEVYEEAAAIARKEHVPVLVHVQEMTQPQGHSTSGSHERYKSKERLAWEEEFDCLRKMREFMLQSAIATEAELDEIDAEAKKSVQESKRKAWDDFTSEIKTEKNQALQLAQQVIAGSENGVFLQKELDDFSAQSDSERRDIAAFVHQMLFMIRAESSAAKNNLTAWFEQWKQLNFDRYSSQLYTEGAGSALRIAEVKPVYDEQPQMIDGREVLLYNHDVLLSRYPEYIAFGEDVGKIGGVNQTFAGLQEKYGEHRVFDVGIREATIAGQGIGMALRGLRPLAEIQYLDYLAYAIQILSDDLACLRYRTKAGQKAPLIISTRGHRLEGIWHSGSPMQFILGALRGMLVLVPRNMTQAAGFYNTLLQADDPALVIEPLNGYRIKEKKPVNLGDFTVPVGVPEIMQQGDDVTLVTYGSCVRVAQDAIKKLQQCGISVELIDVQSLIPFDIHHIIGESVQKTNKVVFLDEDVPGGATAYMMQEVLEKQKAFDFLEAPPVTITAKEHRPAYGSDGDYFSKPNAEDIFDGVYNLMHSVSPQMFPKIF